MAVVIPRRLIFLEHPRTASTLAIVEERFGAELKAFGYEF